MAVVIAAPVQAEALQTCHEGVPGRAGAFIDGRL